MQMRWLTRVGLSESTFFISYPMARVFFCESCILHLVRVSYKIHV